MLVNRFVLLVFFVFQRRHDAGGRRGVGHLHRRHGRLREHLLHDLFPQHVGFDAAQLLFVGLQEAPHFRRVFVAAGDLGDSCGDALVVRGDALVQRNRAYDEGGANALLGIGSHHHLETFGKLPDRLLEARPLQQRLFIHQRPRQLEVVRGDEGGEHLPLLYAADGGIEFHFHPGSHGAAERRHAVVLLGDAEPVEEGVVQFGQVRLFHGAQRDLADGVELLAGDVVLVFVVRVRFVGRRTRFLLRDGRIGALRVVAGRVVALLVVLVGRIVVVVELEHLWLGFGSLLANPYGGWIRARLGSGHADDGSVQLAIRIVDDARLPLAALQRLAFGLDRMIDENPIVVPRRAFDRMPLHLLATQLLHGAVDVAFRDFRLRLAHPQRAVGHDLELREDLEGGGVLQVLALGDRLQVHGDLPGRRQLLLRDRVIQARLQQRRGGLLAQLLAEALPHHLQRHLALAEAGQLHLAGGVPHLLVEQLLDGLRGHRHGDLAFEAVRRLYRYPHMQQASKALIGVDDGIRTHDRRIHNPELYQLSYTHRGRGILQLSHKRFAA